MSEQLQLINEAPLITVHCFFTDGHVVRDPDPWEVHEAMERHYNEQHQADIDSLLGYYATRLHTYAK